MLSPEQIRINSVRHKRHISVVYGEQTKVYFYKFLVLEVDKKQITIRRNPEHINQVTRRLIKHFIWEFCHVPVVVREWNTDEPVFCVNGQNYIMHENILRIRY